MKTICLAVAAYGLGGASALLANDWPQWRGPNRDGISTEQGLLINWPKEGPERIWKKEIGTGFSAVSVANGRLFALGNQNETDTVYGLDPETGNDLWKYSYPSRTNQKNEEWGPCASPTIDGDMVYTFGLRGQFFCFEAATGKILWSKNLAQELGARSPQWGFSSSPVIEGHLVLLNIGNAGAAFDKITGKAAWTTGKEPASYSTHVPCTLSGQKAMAILTANAVAALDPASGKELWRYPWPTPYGLNVSDPIIAGTQVFVSSSYGKGCGLIELSRGQPSLVWENKNMINHFNTCVLMDGYLYGINCDTKREGEGNLRCIEWKTGEVKWSHPGTGAGTQMAVGKRLVVLTGKGELIVADATPAAFKPLARAQVLGGRCWTMPVFANGRLYCRNVQGDLICLDVKENRTAALR